MYKLITKAILSLGAGVALAGSLTACNSTASKDESDSKYNNPVIDAPHFFTADPSPKVWPGDDDRLYMYATYDTTGSFYETEWHVFSSCDLDHWVDHGVALNLKDVPWANEKAWAPDAAYKDGKYYFYFPASAGKGHGMSTDVAVSDSPTGPFKVTDDVPLMNRAHDPAIFKDDDGSHYMYTQKNMVKLADDMVSFDGEPQKLELIGPDIPKKYEAVWVFKRKGIYYWVIAEHFNHFTYWTGDNPYGPFTHRGVIMQGGAHKRSNNHPGIIKYKGKWVLFYHLPHQYKHIPRARRIHAEYLSFNDDGTINEVKPTKEGVKFSCNEK